MARSSRPPPPPPSAPEPAAANMMKILLRLLASEPAVPNATGPTYAQVHTIRKLLTTSSGNQDNEWPQDVSSGAQIASKFYQSRRPSVAKRVQVYDSPPERANQSCGARNYAPTRSAATTHSRVTNGSSPVARATNGRELPVDSATGRPSRPAHWRPTVLSSEVKTGSSAGRRSDPTPSHKFAREPTIRRQRSARASISPLTNYKPHVKIKRRLVQPAPTSTPARAGRPLHKSAATKRANFEVGGGGGNTPAVAMIDVLTCDVDELQSAGAASGLRPAAGRALEPRRTTTRTTTRLRILARYRCHNKLLELPRRKQTHRCSSAPLTWRRPGTVAGREPALISTSAISRVVIKTFALRRPRQSANNKRHCGGECLADFAERDKTVTYERSAVGAIAKRFKVDRPNNGHQGRGRAVCCKIIVQKLSPSRARGWRASPAAAPVDCIRQRARAGTRACEDNSCAINQAARIDKRRTRRRGGKKPVLRNESQTFAEGFPPASGWGQTVGGEPVLPSLAIAPNRLDGSLTRASASRPQKSALIYANLRSEYPHASTTSAQTGGKCWQAIQCLFKLAIMLGLLALLDLPQAPAIKSISCASSPVASSTEFLGRGGSSFIRAGRRRARFLMENDDHEMARVASTLPTASKAAPPEDKSSGQGDRTAQDVTVNTDNELSSALVTQDDVDRAPDQLKTLERNNSSLAVRTSPAAELTEARIIERMVYKWPVIGLVGFMFLGATGNILVCMAVLRERRLQTATNYFLLSLAVADLLVCTLVMPFGIIYEFYGRWPFDWRVCNLWVTCDVLTCSSSILHMCFISVGRYLGIRNPLHARQANLFVSRRAVLWRIAIAWASSALIASPITMMSLYDHKNIVPSPSECAISNKYFMIFGSLIAFFIPMFVMVPSYVMTVRLLSRRAKNVRNDSLMRADAQQQPGGVASLANGATSSPTPTDSTKQRLGGHSAKSSARLQLRRDEFEPATEDEDNSTTSRTAAAARKLMTRSLRAAGDPQRQGSSGPVHDRESGLESQRARAVASRVDDTSQRPASTAISKADCERSFKQRQFWRGLVPDKSDEEDDKNKEELKKRPASSLIELKVNGSDAVQQQQRLGKALNSNGWSNPLHGTTLNCFIDEDDPSTIGTRSALTASGASEEQKMEPAQVPKAATFGRPTTASTTINCNGGGDSLSACLRCGRARLECPTASGHISGELSALLEGGDDQERETVKVSAGRGHAEVVHADCSRSSSSNEAAQPAQLEHNDPPTIRNHNHHATAADYCATGNSHSRLAPMAKGGLDLMRKSARLELVGKWASSARPQLDDDDKLAGERDGTLDSASLTGGRSRRRRRACCCRCCRHQLECARASLRRAHRSKAAAGQETEIAEMTDGCGADDDVVDLHSANNAHHYHANGHGAGTKACKSLQCQCNVAVDTGRGLNVACSGGERADQLNSAKSCASSNELRTGSKTLELGADRSDGAHEFAFGAGSVLTPRPQADDGTGNQCKCPVVHCTILSEFNDHQLGAHRRHRHRHLHHHHHHHHEHRHHRHHHRHDRRVPACSCSASNCKHRSRHRHRHHHHHHHHNHHHTSNDERLNCTKLIAQKDALLELDAPIAELEPNNDEAERTIEPMSRQGSGGTDSTVTTTATSKSDAASEDKREPAVRRAKPAIELVADETVESQTQSHNKLNRGRTLSGNHLTPGDALAPIKRRVATRRVPALAAKASFPAILNGDPREPRMIRYLGSSMQVRSEQKATKVLGVVFFTFTFCWTPFFAINFLHGFVERERLSKFISDELMTLFLWLGYISSTINPVIYTVFNRNFRRAFRRLLLCREPVGRRQFRQSHGSDYFRSFRLSHYRANNNLRKNHHSYSSRQQKQLLDGTKTEPGAPCPPPGVKRSIQSEQSSSTTTGFNMTQGSLTTCNNNLTYNETPLSAGPNEISMKAQVPQTKLTVTSH